MPRLTVIYAERTYKAERQKYEDDPGNYRSPEDYCLSCFLDIDVKLLAHRNSISLSFAHDHLGSMGEAEGLLNDDHPDYEGEDYACVQCGTRLSEDDNEALP